MGLERNQDGTFIIGEDRNKKVVAFVDGVADFSNLNKGRGVRVWVNADDFAVADINYKLVNDDDETESVTKVPVPGWLPGVTNAILEDDTTAGLTFEARW
jgi:hypothetical protein